MNGKQVKKLRRLANELGISTSLAKKCYAEAIRLGAAGKRSTVTHAILASTIAELRYKLANPDEDPGNLVVIG